MMPNTECHFQRIYHDVLYGLTIAMLFVDCAVREKTRKTPKMSDRVFRVIDQITKYGLTFDSLQIDWSLLAQGSEWSCYTASRTSCSL